MDRDVSVQHCIFEAHVDRAFLSIKFPCAYFIEWKTANGKYSVQGKQRPSAVDNQVTFQQTLTFEQDMLLDNHTGNFIKKETLLNINLISRSRKDQVKLVGRINIDLAETANRQAYEEVGTYPLSYCSVDGRVTLSARLKSRVASNMGPEDIDRSSYNEYLSFYSHQNKDLGRQMISQHRSLEARFMEISGREEVLKGGNGKFGDPKREQEEMGSRGQLTMPEKVVRLSNSNSSQQLNFRQTARGGHKRQFREERSNQSITDCTVPRTEKYKLRQTPKKEQNYRPQERPRPERQSKPEELSKPVLYSRPGQQSKQEKREGWHRQPVEESTVKIDSSMRLEMEGNIHKIQQLQRRIKELNNHLQMSKKQVQITQKQNKQKQELINELKSGKPAKDLNANKLQQKYKKVIVEKTQELKMMNAVQEQLKKEVDALTQSCMKLQRETEELRAFWKEKKDHYDEKIRYLQDVRRQKDAKIEELSGKAEAASKFRYQWQLMKELGEQKDSRLRQAQKELLKLSSQFEQIKNNRTGEQNCKLKMELAQSEKALKELGERCQQWQSEVGKFKENYIKISTAYQIQSKNYDHKNERFVQLEGQFLDMQKDNIQLKNTLSSLKEQHLALQNEHRSVLKEQSALSQQIHAFARLREQLEQERDKLLEEIRGLKAVVDKMGVQREVRASESALELKRMESTFMSTLQQKDSIFAAQKKQLEQSIKRQKDTIAQLQQKHSEEVETLESQSKLLKTELDELRQELEKKISTISRLQQTIADKQEIIKLKREQLQNIKESHQQLSVTLARTTAKEREMKDTIAILEEQSQKILQLLQNKEEVEKEVGLLKEQFEMQVKQSEELRVKTAEAERQVEELQHEHQLTLNQLESKQQQLQAKEQEITCLQQQVRQLILDKEELSDTAQETEKLRTIVKDINDRYEQHLGQQQKYIQEIDSLRQQLNSVRQQKEETESELERQGREWQEQSQHLQQRIGQLEEEKSNYEEIVNDSSQSMVEARGKCDQAQIKVEQMQKEIQRLSYTLQQKQSYFLQQEQLLINNKKELELKEQRVRQVEEQLSQAQRQAQQVEAERADVMGKVEGLEREESELKEQIRQLQHELNSARNTLSLQEHQTIQPQSFQKDHQQSQHENQLHEMLLESDRKNQALESRLESLMAELDNLKCSQAQPQEVIYSTFPEFQQQELTKIIEEQRLEIERLEHEVKGREEAEKSAALLEKRVGDLQEHISQIQANFKGEMEKITSHSHLAHSLQTIREEGSEDLNRSERSLINSISRVRSSLQGGEIIDLRDKLSMLQQERDKLEEEYCSIEEEKFNLLSTINEKDILIEDLQQCRSLLNLEIARLVQVNGDLNFKIKGLQSEVDHLKGQMTFGENILFGHEGTMTRSQPILMEESKILINKEIEIENLKAEIQKQRGREEELMWNIRDLEMQLETVTDNLNLLNASSMNSIIMSSNKIGDSLQSGNSDKGKEKSGDEGYDKQKLLLSLKKNQELKEIAHGIIRALKEREQNWKQQQVTMNEFKKEMQAERERKIKTATTIQGSTTCLNQLFRHFQGIKLYVMRQESEAAKSYTQKDIVKSVLVLEEALREARLLE